LGSKFDLTCDYIVASLLRRDVTYLRLNSEDLTDAAIALDPLNATLSIQQAGRQYSITHETLRSVLFRRPVFLRDYGEDLHDAHSRFSLHQWAAFVRNLMLFDGALWMNAPPNTYRAEHKAVQLAEAAKVGFSVPETRITNAPAHNMFSVEGSYIATKGLDTVLIRTGGQEFFGFTNFDYLSNIQTEQWRTAPATFQVALQKKLDIRVTVVVDKVLAASITTDGTGVEGDWRTQKKDVDFTAYDLPKSVGALCVELTRRLGLNFGAIDLAYADGDYYFLEINPTGEWAWLVDGAGLAIDEAIADALCAMR
jgi:glutathione synthase/RimK-type ligase-like ATP-grasp enzyme